MDNPYNKIQLQTELRIDFDLIFWTNNQTVSNLHLKFTRLHNTTLKVSPVKLSIRTVKVPYCSWIYSVWTVSVGITVTYRDRRGRRVGRTIAPPLLLLEIVFSGSTWGACCKCKIQGHRLFTATTSALSPVAPMIFTCFLQASLFNLYDSYMFHTGPPFSFTWFLHVSFSPLLSLTWFLHVSYRPPFFISMVFTGLRT